MLFTSMEFIFVFFPVTLAVYFILPQKARNYWLLIASLFFYAWGEPAFVFAMLFSILFNYLIALRIVEFKEKSAGRRLMLAVAIAVNLGLLFVFKYMNFATETLRRFIPQTQALIPQTSIVLPIGISFFTFQAMSYVIDVYRGIPAQKNPAYLGLYISLFPQLIAGPIVRYTTVMDQIDHRTITVESFSKGLLRFMRGFNKKVLIANLVAEAADVAFASGELSVMMAWLGALCYTLQIFFDFSGYSDMAIGLGQLFGFKFLENFDYPYISRTITEFWRRWHISLGTWFRDYLYFPLGGSRVKSKLRLVFNLSVVWLATGIWHGASWNFILWGMMYGVLIIIEKIADMPKKLPKYKVPAALYQAFAMVMVMLGWVIFRAEGITAALTYLKAMFGLNGNIFIDTAFKFNAREYLAIIIAGIVCSTPVFKLAGQKITSGGGALLTVYRGAVCIVQFLLFIVSISFLVMNAHNPFIYFNF